MKRPSENVCMFILRCIVMLCRATYYCLLWTVGTVAVENALTAPLLHWHDTTGTALFS
jgi:hypothetical protein